MNNKPQGGKFRHFAAAYVRRVDALNARIGAALRWLLLAMAAVALGEIFVSQAFNFARVWVDESILYMHGVLLMLASADTLRAGGHVRIDVFYSRLSEAGRARVNLFGVFCFLLPVCAVIFYFSFPYVAEAWRVRESSPEGEGLPAVFLLKTCLLGFPVLMALQGLALAGKSYLTLTGGAEADAAKE